MEIRQLLLEARKIWGNNRLVLPEIIIRAGKILGDMCRYARNEKITDAANEEELKKEMGNLIFSTIRWCDDLGYDPEDCIKLAVEAQKKYQKDVYKNNTK